ncbi:MAG: SDR family oxidoreductase [Oleispira antarctica]|uniref:Short chain dehydrogenase n=1 Tax=Oleispira antarctica RB-8 TaxID=698738 RepID=R4YS66_OLEAN|nr:SDR family oxidoreductase [Oleispira antarctica]MBQ0793075.1 SDR family oxidoreductase [Oleispira antarctica]CCK74939.1 Short chain dehydrogenase [Oleispira antarctica RB-8]
MNNFADKVVLITGAGNGIGRATALAFAQQGASVVVADINRADGEETAAMITQAGGIATFMLCDVTKDQDVQSMVEGTVETYGKLDIAFNNAGIEIEQSKLADGDEATYDKIMDVNVKGVWRCMKYQIPALLKQSTSAIVNTASIAGLGAAPKMSIYSASKHAVIGLTKSAAVEYGKKGLRVNAICPAVIDTEMFRRATQNDPQKEQYVKSLHPVGRIGQPDEVAAAVLYLCSDLAGFTTGVALPIDGGATSI